MGIGGISIWQLLIILVIVMLLFGTKRLRNLGGDLGAAIRGFRTSMGNEEENKEEDDETVEKSEAVEQQETKTDSEK